MNLGEYLKDLRLRHALTLKEVEIETEISISYLSQIEKGIKSKPQPHILKKLAELYKVNEQELMELAGYIKPDKYPKTLEEQEINRAFEFVKTDPNFKFGHRISGELDMDAKKFIIELYEEATGKNLLGGKTIDRKPD